MVACCTAGEIAYRKADYAAAFAHLRRAVELDDGLPFDEPWGWMQPTRHALGALLLEQVRVWVPGGLPPSTLLTLLTLLPTSLCAPPPPPRRTHRRSPTPAFTPRVYPSSSLPPPPHTRTPSLLLPPLLLVFLARAPRVTLLRRR